MFSKYLLSELFTAYFSCFIPSTIFPLYLICYRNISNIVHTTTKITITVYTITKKFSVWHLKNEMLYLFPVIVLIFMTHHYGMLKISFKYWNSSVNMYAHIYFSQHFCFRYYYVYISLV